MTTQKCDFCSEEFTGPSYPVYDENYNLEEGVIMCGKCFGLQTGVEPEKE